MVPHREVVLLFHFANHVPAVPFLQNLTFVPTSHFACAAPKTHNTLHAQLVMSAQYVQRVRYVQYASLVSFALQSRLVSIVCPKSTYHLDLKALY
jgi:hypothetical protein